MRASRLEKCRKMMTLARGDKLSRILFTDEKIFTPECAESAGSSVKSFSESRQGSKTFLAIRDGVGWSAVGPIFRVSGRRMFGYQFHPISALWISLSNLSWSKKSALPSTSH
ncbi:hypothetical protein Y032_0745g2011 [Ancylostoma ceylanicum]|uniref:Uncharacterized protein n=1 Tax=Ancylostoma ceylanicum TaxID=53326 RepID=A0A016WES0_9BILA|nr:hypothetical protein Y032_0745g2011 [Ancylostoma ceylanicum]